MNRKTFLTGAIALATVGLSMPAFAQAIPATVDQPVTITYYNYNLASAGNGAEATKRMIADFEKANPNIKVEGIGASSADITSRIQADVAAGRIPDVVQMVFSDLNFTVDNLGAAALEDIVPADELAAISKASRRTASSSASSTGRPMASPTPSRRRCCSTMRISSARPGSIPRIRRRPGRT